MAHLIDKDALVAEIERLKDDAHNGVSYHQSRQNVGLNNELSIWEHLENAFATVLKNIDTLEVKEVQEEPVSEDLEDAAKHYLYSNILYDDVYVGNPTDKDCIEMFKAGAQWQKEHLLAGVDVEAMINESRKNLPRILPKEAIENILDIYKEGILDTLKVIKGEITL